MIAMIEYYGRIKDFFTWLDRAECIRYNEKEQLLYVWNGSMTVNIYNLELNNVDMFTFGEKPDPEDVYDLIGEHIKEIKDDN